MNPILPDGAIPDLGGYLDLMMLFSIAGVAVIFAMLLWLTWMAGRRRARLRCPVRWRSVRVVFRLAPDGTETDVLRCSVFGRRPITCGKVCLRRTAPA